MGTTVTYRNYSHRPLNLESACYYSVQKLLSSRLLSENLNIEIVRPIILPVVLCRCKTRFVNRVLRGMYGPKREQVVGVWRTLRKNVKI
jgi:hypothetical protein